MSISRASERGGFTLLEALIGATILAGLLAIGMQTLSGSTRQVSQSLMLDEMRMQANQALHKIAQDLKASERGAVAINSAGNELRLRRTDMNTSTWAQDYSAVYVYSVSSGQLVVDFVGRLTLASNVTAFTVGPAGEDPLTSDTVTLSLTLTRQVGVKAGTPETLSVTATRQVYVRPNLIP